MCPFYSRLFLGSRLDLVFNTCYWVHMFTRDPKHASEAKCVLFIANCFWVPGLTGCTSKRTSSVLTPPWGGVLQMYFRRTYGVLTAYLRRTSRTYSYFGTAYLQRTSGVLPAYFQGYFQGGHLPGPGGYLPGTGRLGSQGVTCRGYPREVPSPPGEAVLMSCFTGERAL